MDAITLLELSRQAQAERDLRDLVHTILKHGVMALQQPEGSDLWAKLKAKYPLPDFEGDFQGEN